MPKLELNIGEFEAAISRVKGFILRARGRKKVDEEHDKDIVPPMNSFRRMFYSALQQREKEWTLEAYDVAASCLLEAQSCLTGCVNALRESLLMLTGAKRLYPDVLEDVQEEVAKDVGKLYAMCEGCQFYDNSDGIFNAAIVLLQAVRQQLGNCGSCAEEVDRTIRYIQSIPEHVKTGQEKISLGE